MTNKTISIDIENKHKLQLIPKSINGEEVAKLSDGKLSRIRNEKIGFVFQAFHLLPGVTALDNVTLPLVYSRNPPSDIKERAREVLAKVGLEHRLHHTPGQLSGGEQQRVALARAFTPEPSILLADEPTVNLDGETGKKIMDLLFSLKDRCNTTMVLVTHQPELAMRCSRTIHMQDGKISNGC